MKFRSVKLVRETQDPALPKGARNTRDEFSAPDYDVTLEDDQLNVRHAASDVEIAVPWSAVLWASKFPTVVDIQMSAPATPAKRGKSK